MTAGLLAWAGVESGRAGVDPADPFKEVVIPFLETHCYECHGIQSKKAGLDLTLHRDDAGILEEYAHWRTLLQQVNTGEMPPKKFPIQPEPAAISAFNDALQATFARAQAALPPNPGRVTLRRLNRAEYNNTVRDLLGVDYNASENFPSDDIGHGFDNIGDVLSLSPVHLERYLDAAEGVATRAIALRLPRPPTRTTASIFLEPRGYRSQNSTRPVANDNNELFTQHSIQEAGQYVFRVRAGATNGPGVKPPVLVLRVDDEEVHRVTVENPPAQWANFDVPMELEARDYRFSVAFLNPSELDPDWQPEPPVAGGEAGDAEATALADSEEAGSGENAVPDAAPGRESMVFINEFRVIGPADTRTAFMKRVDAVRGVEWQAPEDFATVGRGGRSNREIDVAQAVALSDDVPEERITEVVAWFLRRAFRRPPEADEVTRYERVLNAGREAANGNFYVGLQEMVKVALCSPKFLFRVELDDRPVGEEPHALDAHHVASRLSYFLWSSMPDETLLALADTGRLLDEAALKEQVTRMLKDPRADALVENFGLQWLQLQRFRTFQPDLTQFPEFTEPLRLSMLLETQLFLREIVREDRSILDLIGADFTYVNRTLARHYGVRENVFREMDQAARGGRRGGGPPDPADFVRVTFDQKDRGGLLTQASILASTSNPTRTSPVKRGKWVLEQLLGTPPPEPPPGVEELEDQHELTGTLRQRMEQHRANPACATCHQTMDAMGFAFENFDVIGRWRDKDGGEPIDASGILPDGRQFNGAGELKEVLLDRKALLARNLTEKLLIYGLGRGLEFYDERAIQGILKGVEAGEYRFSEVVQGIVQSEPFRMRRGREVASAGVTEQP